MIAVVVVAAAALASQCHAPAEPAPPVAIAEPHARAVMLVANGVEPGDESLTSLSLALYTRASDLFAPADLDGLRRARDLIGGEDCDDVQQVVELVAPMLDSRYAVGIELLEDKASRLTVLDRNDGRVTRVVATVGPDDDGNPAAAMIRVLRTLIVSSPSALSKFVDEHPESLAQLQSIGRKLRGDTAAPPVAPDAAAEATTTTTTTAGDSAPSDSGGVDSDDVIGGVFIGVLAASAVAVVVWGAGLGVEAASKNDVDERAATFRTSPTASHATALAKAGDAWAGVHAWNRDVGPWIGGSGALVLTTVLVVAGCSE